MNRTNCLFWIEVVRHVAPYTFNQVSPLRVPDGRSGRNDSASATGDFDAAGAEVGVGGVCADAGPEVPAPLAFGVGAFLGARTSLVKSICFFLRADKELHRLS